jgi:hypothetical protein
VHLDLAQECAARASDAQKEEEEGGNHDGIYTDFDGGEDDDEDAGPPDDTFDRRDSPIGVNLGRGRDEIGDGVNNDR